MKFLYSFLFISLSLSLHFLFAQDISYAHKVIDTLSSVSMHGRGYVNDGDKMAATYIRNEFINMKLSSFTENYFQAFNFPVNTFPGTVNVSVDEKNLSAGKNFIVAPGSPSIKGDFGIVWIKPTDIVTKKQKRKLLRKDYASKAIVFDAHSKEEKELSRIFINSLTSKPALVIFTTEKLTWSVAQKVDNIPGIEILNGSILTTDKKIMIDVESNFITFYSTQNILGYIKGTTYPDSFIVFCAHYDHLGQMGRETYFPGANDNASGTSMLLNLANYFSSPGNKPKYSIAFMAFGAEEAGLVGSKYYTENPVFPLRQIKFLINLDLMGNGEEGITIVNATEFKNEFQFMVELNDKHHYVKEIKSRGKAANSDHYYFSEKGVHCFFIYTLGGSKAYHDIYDNAGTIPLFAFEKIVKLVIDFTSYLGN